MRVLFCEGTVLSGMLCLRTRLASFCSLWLSTYMRLVSTSCQSHWLPPLLTWGTFAWVYTPKHSGLELVASFIKECMARFTYARNVEALEPSFNSVNLAERSASGIVFGLVGSAVSTLAFKTEVATISASKWRRRNAASSPIVGAASLFTCLAHVLNWTSSKSAPGVKAAKASCPNVSNPWFSRRVKRLAERPYSLALATKCGLLSSWLVMAWTTCMHQNQSQMWRPHRQTCRTPTKKNIATNTQTWEELDLSCIPQTCATRFELWWHASMPKVATQWHNCLGRSNMTVHTRLHSDYTE